MEIHKNMNNDIKIAIALICLSIAMVIGVVMIGNRTKVQNRAAEIDNACTYNIKVTCKALKKCSKDAQGVEHCAPDFKGNLEIVDEDGKVVAGPQPVNGPDEEISFAGGVPGKKYQCRARPSDDLRYCYKDTGTTYDEAPACGPKTPTATPSPTGQGGPGPTATPGPGTCKDCDALMCSMLIDDSGKTNIVKLVISYKKDSCKPQDFVCKDGSVTIERGDGKKVPISESECQKMINEGLPVQYKIHQSNGDKCVDYVASVNGARCQDAKCTTEYCCPTNCAKIEEVPPTSGFAGDGCSDKCNFEFTNPNEGSTDSCLKLPDNTEAKVRIVAGSGGIDFDDDFSTEDEKGAREGDTVSYKYNDGGFYDVQLTCLDAQTEQGEAYPICTKRVSIMCGGGGDGGGTPSPTPPNKCIEIKPVITFECKDCATPTPCVGDSCPQPNN